MGEARQRRLAEVGAVLREIRKPVEFGSFTDLAIATRIDSPYSAIRLATSSAAVTLPGPDCGA